MLLFVLSIVFAVCCRSFCYRRNQQMLLLSLLLSLMIILLLVGVFVVIEILCIVDVVDLSI